MTNYSENICVKPHENAPNGMEVMSFQKVDRQTSFKMVNDMNKVFIYCSNSLFDLCRTSSFVILFTQLILHNLLYIPISEAYIFFNALPQRICIKIIEFSRFKRGGHLARMNSSREAQGLNWF